MSSTAHFPDAASFQRQSDEFITWLSQKPGVRINPHIQITDLRFQGAGRGVVACANIDDGEELFVIPRDVLLTVQNSGLKNQLSQDLHELDPWFSLIVVMIHEYLLGERSTWAHYFRVLPTKFDTLMFWTESELQELQNSAIVEKIGKADANQSILEMVAPIVRANPLLFPPINGLDSYDGDKGEEALLALAHQMGSLIMAYAFDIEKAEDEEDDGEDGYITDEEEQLPKGIVPLADLLNADADRNNARLFQEEKFLVMRATKPIKAGDELFNDYGELPRGDLLRRYGYITDNYAQYDIVEIPLELLCVAGGLASADPERQPRLKLLADLGVLEDGYCIPRPSPGASIVDILPEELLALVKTLALTREQVLEQKSKPKPPKPALGVQEAQIIQEAMQKLVSRYKTSIEEDEAILNCYYGTESSIPLESSSHRKWMAVQVRLGEKQILRQVSAMLTNYIANAIRQNEGSSAKRNAPNPLNGDARKAKFQRI